MSDPFTIGYYDMDGKRITGEEAAERYWRRDGAPDFPRCVAFTKLANGVEVSTVLLVIDHNHSGVGPPLIFETMAFEPAGPRGDFGEGLDQQRYATKAEALAGHEACCKRFEAWPTMDTVVEAKPEEEGGVGTEMKLRAMKLGEHWHVAVFGGVAGQTLAQAGPLCFREPEWNAFRDALYWGAMKVGIKFTVEVVKDDGVKTVEEALACPGTR